MVKFGCLIPSNISSFHNEFIKALSLCFKELTIKSESEFLNKESIDLTGLTSFFRDNTITIVFDNVDASIRDVIEDGVSNTLLITKENVFNIVRLLNFKKTDDPKYNTDFLYVGNPQNVAFIHIAGLFDKYNTHCRIFWDKPVPIYGYAGYCQSSHIMMHYRNAKYCICPTNFDLPLKLTDFLLFDVQSGRLLDSRLAEIIFANGTPIIVSAARVDDSVELVKNIIETGEYNLDMNVFRRLRKKLIDEHTVFDELSRMFSDFGLQKAAKVINNAKKGVFEYFNLES